MKKYLVTFSTGVEEMIEAENVDKAFEYEHPVNPEAFGEVVAVEEIEEGPESEKMSVVLDAISADIEFDATYNRMKEAGDMEGIEALREEVWLHREFLEELDKKMEGFGFIYRNVKRATDVGNEYIDIYEPLHWNTPAEVMKFFRDYGVTEFTMSSKWSSAVEDAWEFQKAGAKVVGMVEVNDNIKDFMSEEWKKVPAYLFEV